jgi:hypothetical protein
MKYSLGGSRTRLLSAPSFEDQTELLNQRLGFFAFLTAAKRLAPKPRLRDKRRKFNEKRNKE